MGTNRWILESTTHSSWDSLRVRHLYPSIDIHTTSKCVNASPSMLVRRVSRWTMPAGSCTAWSMVYSQMDRCLLTRQLVAGMIPSTLSSVKPAQESMYQEQYL